MVIGRGKMNVFTFNEIILFVDVTSGAYERAGHSFPPNQNPGRLHVTQIATRTGPAASRSLDLITFSSIVSITLCVADSPSAGLYFSPILATSAHK